jgi:hypothetical protein
MASKTPGTPFSCNEDGIEYDCVVKNYGYQCIVDAKTPKLDRTKKIAARSIGANVSASSEYSNFYSIKNGVINSPGCWVTKTPENGGWFQYSFSKPVYVLEVLTQGCANTNLRA